jgi:hypothetical protein
VKSGETKKHVPKGQLVIKLSALNKRLNEASEHLKQFSYVKIHCKFLTFEIDFCEHQSTLMNSDSKHRLVAGIIESSYSILAM